MHVCLLHTCFSAGCLLCFLLPSSSPGEQQLLSGPAAKACSSEELASPLGKALSFGSPPVMERKRGAWWRALGTQRDGIWWGWGFDGEGRGLVFSSQPTSEGVSLQGHVGLAPAGALGYNSCEWLIPGGWRSGELLHSLPHRFSTLLSLLLKELRGLPCLLPLSLPAY